MGCSWDDLSGCGKEVAKGVDRAVGTNLSGDNPNGNLAGGDIAKFFGTTAKNLGLIATAPIQATLDLAKGDTKSAGSRYVKSYGAIADISTGNMTSIYSSDGGQKFLRNNLGLNNMAGFYAGANQARNEGTISNQYRDETIRYARDAAIIGGAAYAYSNPVIPTGTEAGYVSGKELITGLTFPAGKDVLLYGATAKSLIKSDNPLKEITKEILGKDVADIIFPSNPNNPVTSNPSDSQEYGPWDSSVSSGVNPVVGKQGQSVNSAAILSIGAGILITYLIIKKVRS